MGVYHIVGGPDHFWVRNAISGERVNDHGVDLAEAQRICRRENAAERDHEKAVSKIRENDHT